MLNYQRVHRLDVLSIYLSIHPSIYLWIWLNLSICLSICLSVYLSIFLSVCLSVCLSMYLTNLFYLVYPSLFSSILFQFQFYFYSILLFSTTILFDDSLLFHFPIPIPLFLARRTSHLAGICYPGCQPSLLWWLGSHSSIAAGLAFPKDSIGGGLVLTPQDQWLVVGLFFRIRSVQRFFGKKHGDRENPWFFLWDR